MTVHKSRVLILVALLLTACSSASSDTPTTTSIPPTDPPAGGQSATQTPNPDPLAARVNGTPIYLEEYLRELMREESGRQAMDMPVPADRAANERRVLDRMIESVLIEQAAEAAGITLSVEELSDEVAQSIEDAGGGQGWNDWLTMSNLTPQEYREQLRVQLIGGMMIDQIAAQVPEMAEQVHARHILVDSRATAEDVLHQLQSGADFAELAGRYSLDASTRETGGDLTWFARGQLLESEVEEAAFSLQPGEISPIIASRLGYHIVQTLERDPARPLDEVARETLLQIAIERWRQELWDGADIQRLVGAGS